MKTPGSSMALVLLASVIGSFGAVCLKSGSLRIRAIRDLLFNTRLIAGVTLFLISSFVYLLGLRQGEVSVLYPMVSMANVWTLFWSRIFFREPITRAKTVGLLLILVGVFFIGLGADGS